MNPSKNTTKQVLRWAKADHEKKEMFSLKRDYKHYSLSCWVIGRLVKEGRWDFENQKLK